MNENIDLTEILKDCPKGTKLYSSTLGDVTFIKVYKGGTYPIIVYYNEDGVNESFTADGKILKDKGECTLFPSKDQRDWSKFSAPWYKKDKFDPKTLKPFDKVLVRINDSCDRHWYADFVSLSGNNISVINIINRMDFDELIPYNDDTKHLVGTTEEAPEYYRYWED